MKGFSFLGILAIVLLMPILIHGQQNNSELATSIRADGLPSVSGAMQDVQSTDKGVLFSRMDSIQRAAIPGPAAGLLVYQTDKAAGFYYYDGSAWIPIHGELDAYNLLGYEPSVDFSCMPVTGSLGIDSGPISVAVSGNYTYVVDQGNTDLKVIDVRGSGNATLTTNPINGSFEEGLPVFWENSGKNIYNTNNGNVGVGTSSPVNKLDIEGGLALGPGYSGTSTAPVNGAIIEGKVGIGTSNPTYKLHVNGDVKLASGSKLILDRTSGTDEYAYIGANSPFWAGIKFRTTQDTQGIVKTAMTIHSRNGRVGIGTASPGHPLHMGSGAHVTSAGVWISVSDIRKKYDIDPLSYGLKEVLKLYPVSYKYKTDHSESIGFIAQDMEAIIPEVVSGKEGGKGIGYGLLTSVLVNAIQEQQFIIDELKKELNQQKTNFEARIRALEAAQNSTTDKNP